MWRELPCSNLYAIPSAFFCNPASNKSYKQTRCHLQLYQIAMDYIVAKTSVVKSYKQAIICNIRQDTLLKNIIQRSFVEMKTYICNIMKSSNDDALGCSMLMCSPGFFLTRGICVYILSNADLHTHLPKRHRRGAYYFIVKAVAFPKFKIFKAYVSDLNVCEPHAIGHRKSSKL